MDLLTFLAKLAEVLVWPLTTLILAFLLKPHFASLIDSIDHFKAPGVELKMREHLDRGAKLLKQDEPAAPRQLEAEAGSYTTKMSQQLQAATADMIERYYWRLLESVAAHYAKVFPQATQAPQIQQLAELLRTMGLIDELHFSLAQEAEAVRSTAAHATVVTGHEASVYREMCERLESVLIPALDRLKGMLTGPEADRGVMG